jgi:DNA (cytosine-5)-methyltransferase 1
MATAVAGLKDSRSNEDLGPVAPLVQSAAAGTDRFYTLADVFAGCGGMTRGFLDSGRFQSIYAVESDPDAAATYRLNFGDHVVESLIEDVASFPEVDVLIGGPPCQGFSALNRGAVGFERRGLWREYLRALESARPRAFVMENVPALLRSAEYAEFKSRAGRLGFLVEEDILNAADYGVPQIRKRAIVIGARVGTAIRWAAPTHSNPESPRLAAPRPWKTFRAAVAGLSIEPDGRTWHRARNPRPESELRYRAVPLDGGDRFDMERNLDDAGLGHLVFKCWRERPGQHTDVFGRLRWDKPAVTIRTDFRPEKGRYLHPEAHRCITVREAARCMSFSDRFSFPEEQTLTSVSRQIGNAVPPDLAQGIATALAASLDDALVTGERDSLLAA